MAAGLAEQGAKVMVSSRKIDQCEAAVAKINETCGEERAHAFACNAGYKDQLEALVTTGLKDMELAASFCAASGIEVVVAATIAPVSWKAQSLSVIAARMTASCHSNGTER